LIDPHFQAIEKVIRDDLLVTTFDIDRTYMTHTRAYIKGKINFADGSSLAFFQHVQMAEEGLHITDYRYHYMDADAQMIFRYDNAPHHRELGTFPHHKHLPTGLQCTLIPDFEKILKEIDNIILKSIL